MHKLKQDRFIQDGTSVLSETRQVLKLLYPEVEDTKRPKTRGDCEGGLRPCPWVGCKYSLRLETDPATGTLKSYPGTQESCALDVAEQGEHSLEEIAVLLGCTRERVRQIEERALNRLQQAERRKSLREKID